MPTKTCSKKLLAVRNPRPGARIANGRLNRPPLFVIYHFRHGIERRFSGLTDRFTKKKSATSAKGFTLKIGLFFFVHALGRFGL